MISTLNPNATIFVSNTPSKTLNPNAKEFTPTIVELSNIINLLTILDEIHPEIIQDRISCNVERERLHSQFKQIPQTDGNFRQVCQFGYKDYDLAIDWDEENHHAILYGNIYYTWQCPDMSIRDIIDWWCDSQINIHPRPGYDSALDMLVSQAPLCSFDVEDTPDYDGILDCGCCDTCCCCI